MATIEFTKMQGAGNDFIMIDNRTGVLADARKKEFVTRFCPRALAVGADGVIFLENDPELPLRWDFYNADGSSAEMCGNGARCFALFAQACGVVTVGESFSFRTLAGVIRARLTGENRAEIGLTDAPLPVKTPELEVAGTKMTMYFINTGVPHAVVPVEDLDAVPLREYGAAIRYHTHFAPKGTNANFIARRGNEVFIRTYERGVEDETLACGTGSVAAAIVAGECYGLSSPVAVRPRSGDTLNISYTREATGITNVLLEGPAVQSFTGRVAF